MTALASTPPDVTVRRRDIHVVRALAGVEARRMLLNPLLWVGVGLSVWVLWSAVPEPDEWVGATYQDTAIAIVPFALAVSVVVATSFHRERVPVAGGVPTGESARCLARLVAALPLVLLAVGISAFTAWRQRDVGGLMLGVEPGRTTEALFTAGELAQPVALAVLAVAVGAVIGRRTSTMVAAVPLLFVLWLVTSVYWFYADRRVTPFSIVQAQPISLPAGPSSADPLSFPAHWLLVAPDEFSQQWTRAFVSDALAWWHAAWLIGLALLWLSVALPARPARRPLVIVGAVLAVLGVAAQYVVLA